MAQAWWKPTALTVPKMESRSFSAGCHDARSTLGQKPRISHSILTHELRSVESRSRSYRTTINL